MVTIDKAFSTENRSVYEYFQRPAIGFYIPLYQREYSWDQDNVDQLLEDLSSGIEQLTSDRDKDNSEIRFLGTIITVTEVDKNRIQPQDVRALPTAIEKVIDGQQRLSTIALLACLLHRNLTVISDSLIKAAKQLRNEEGEGLQAEFTAISSFWKERLDDLYSVDLKRGNPTRKPKIIRGKQDKWILEERDNESYNSSVASFLFEYIEFAKAGGRAPKLQGLGLVKTNLRQMDTWIRNQVMRSHVLPEPEFPKAGVIVAGIKEDQLWQYERANLVALVRQYTRDSKEASLEFLMNSFTQLLAVCHYLLDRCCFTVIQPISDDWAFDMFQSLNATGTPLTAIETFKPLVVNTVEQANRSFKGSDIERFYSRVERPFEGVKNTAQKNKLTNDLLTSFAIAVNGHKLPSHFSSQRKWLEQTYQSFNADDQSKYIKYFGDYATYFYDIWLNYDARDQAVVPGVPSMGDGILGSTLLLFLKKSRGHLKIVGA